MANLSAHFTEFEFMCKTKVHVADQIPCPYCKGMVKAEPLLLAAAEDLRGIIQRPLIVTCGHRCTLGNVDAHGEGDSQHLLGKAMDCKAEGITPEELAAIAHHEIEAFRYGGIGVYASFTHLDVRGYSARWGGKFEHVDVDALMERLNVEGLKV